MVRDPLWASLVWRSRYGHQSTGTSPIWRHIRCMLDPKEPKDKDQFGRLMAQIEVLRGRAVQEFAKALPPQKRKRIVDNLRDVLSKLTGRKS
jgi:hypothetical protein